MHARIPLDVDLEDKLLYGLTPIRLGYLVIGLLAAFSTWSTHWAPTTARALVAVMLGALGAVAAWGRLRGRAVDGWLVDAAIYCLSNYRLGFRPPRWWWHR